MVREGERHVEKKRRAALGISGDVFDCAVGDHSVDLPARVLVVDTDVARLLSFPPFADVVDIAQRHLMVRRPVDDVRGLEAEPFVEALIGRQSSFSRADVPFAKDRRAVARFAEHLRERDLPRVQPARRTRRHGLANARTDRQTARHQRGAAGRTLVFDIEICQPQALGSELVHSRRWGIENAAIVRRWHAISDIVAEDENDVGPRRSWLSLRRTRCSCGRECAESNGCRSCEQADGFPAIGLHDYCVAIASRARAWCCAARSSNVASLMSTITLWMVPVKANGVSY